jgi:periplasmic protein TonB
LIILNKLNYPQSVPNLSSRAIIFALVVSAHAVVFAAWSTQPDRPLAPQHDLSVSFAVLAQAPLAVIPPQAKPARLPTPVAQPAPAEEAVALAEPVPVVAAPSVTTAAPNPSPAVVDTEPDYKASYLNNPSPAYPMLARRNGLQGRVVLQVEVLADGSCGKVNIQSSSGYAMLDNAAMNSVKTWRFTPARQGGLAVDKWFMIPVQFSLKDKAV